MRSLLEAILPRFELPIEPLVRDFNGKKDLESKAPGQMRSWYEEPGIEPRFVIVQDNDTADCREVKQRLVERCQEGHRRFLVRLVMQELESWFYGDLAAVAAAYSKPKIVEAGGRRGYRVPDAIPRPSVALARLLGDDSKVDRAERIAPHMDLERNTSTSFRVFCDGVRRLTEAA